MWCLRDIDNSLGPGSLVGVSGGLARRRYVFFFFFFFFFFFALTSTKEPGPTNQPGPRVQ